MIQTNNKQLNKWRKIGIFFSTIVLFLTYCKPVKDGGKIDEIWHQDKHRPQFHFTPQYGWMNDPNGMVYFDGEYHLFYQYYPDSTVWGPMHWGHTVSKDLVHWEHLPIGLYPDSLGWIFSGSAVYDENNTSGFGKNGINPLIAIYTHHNAPMEQTGVNTFQYQSISYSLDRGRTWVAYGGNPVIENPGIRDFRDPNVFWHEDTGQWIMILSALNKVMLYGSADLKNWQYLSDFGADKGSHDGVWECPDLFPLVADDGNKYWVLILNMNPGNPNGGSGTQYFIGDFDGRTFILNPKFDELLLPIPEYNPGGEIFEDFESGLENWDAEGNAFSISNRAKGTGSMVSSIMLNNAQKGMLISEKFTIEKAAINFQIGGGNHRSKTLIGLEVDGRLVREAEGNNNAELTWKGWDVSPFIGKQARIKIIDNYEGDFGFIEVDQITFSDEVAHGEISGSVWLDAGADNYAGVTWSNIPETDGRKLFIGWMSNWAYAQIVPTENWRSAMTVPWELKIKIVDGIPRLTSYPVKELNKLRNESEIKTGAESVINLPSNGLADIEMTIPIKGNEKMGFRLGNDLNEYIEFTFHPELNEFLFNRAESGQTNFSPDFVREHRAFRISKSELLKFRIFIDHSSIEIFIDDGLNVFTELFFPNVIYNKMEIFGPENKNVSIHPLNAIW